MHRAGCEKPDYMPVWQWYIYRLTKRACNSEINGKMPELLLLVTNYATPGSMLHWSSKQPFTSDQSVVIFKYSIDILSGALRVAYLLL